MSANFTRLWRAPGLFFPPPPRAITPGDEAPKGPNPRDLPGTPFAPRPAFRAGGGLVRRSPEGEVGSRRSRFTLSGAQHSQTGPRASCLLPFIPRSEFRVPRLNDAFRPACGLASVTHPSRPTWPEPTAAQTVSTKRGRNPFPDRRHVSPRPDLSGVVPARRGEAERGARGTLCSWIPLARACRRGRIGERWNGKPQTAKGNDQQ